MRSLWLVLIVTACGQRPRVAPSTSSGATRRLVDLSIASPPFRWNGRDAPAFFGTSQTIDVLTRAGIDFVSVEEGPWGAFDWDGWLTAHFEAISRRGGPLRVAVVIGGAPSACAPTSLQLAAELIWQRYANGAFADRYQQVDDKPLLLVRCDADTRWDDDGLDRFTIRISSETPPKVPHAAPRTKLTRWRSITPPASGVPTEAIEQLGVSLEDPTDWNALLDLDPTVLTLRGPPERVSAARAQISAFKSNRGELIIRDTGTGLWHFRSAPTFSAETVMAWAPGRHYQPTACDFDGDGFTDVALRDSNPAAAGRWHFRRGPRLHGKDEWALAWPERSGPDYDALAADFDGDGLCELAVRHRQSGVVSWRGAFNDAKEQSHNFPPGESALLGDFNGDGQLDLAINERSSQDARTFTIYLGPRFGPEDTGQLVWPKQATSLGVAGDFDGDARTELGVLDSTGAFCVRAMGQPASAEACSPAAFLPGMQVLSANVR